MTDRDEWISLLLGAAGAIWLLGGLALFALLARWLGPDWGIPIAGLRRVVLVAYLASLGAIAMGSIFFQIRSSLRSGHLFGIVLFILQAALALALGRAVWVLLRGG